MAKRARTKSEGPGGGRDSLLQCPVCLDDTVFNPLFPFDCGHEICRRCDAELFSRADDRCPMCRQPRTQDSVDSNLRGVMPYIAQRRSVALAQRQSESAARQPVLFFPAEGIIAIDATDFVVAAHAHVDADNALNEQEVRLALSSSQVSTALGALVNASETPLSEFYIAVAALRSQRGNAAQRLVRRSRVS